MNEYVTALRKYAEFSGRARRKEYWTFWLLNLLIALVLGFLEGALNIAPDTDQSVFAIAFELVVLVPTIAVGVRRMHDTDHSGWWLLLPVVNFIFAVTPGQRCENRFGPDPKGASGGFCTRCGTPFPGAAAYCPKCGNARTASPDPGIS